MGELLGEWGWFEANPTTKVLGYKKAI